MTLSVSSVTVDCAEMAAVAGFWSAALELPVDPDASPYFASINRNQAELPRFLFIKVPEAKVAKNRMHLDLLVEDSGSRTDEVARLVGLGATLWPTRTSGGTPGRCSPIPKATSSVSPPRAERSRSALVGPRPAES